MAQAAIIGNVGKDPELKYGQNGSAYCRFSIAWSERSKDKTGAWVDGPTVWVSVIVFNRLAEAVAADMHKGMRVVVSGDLKPETWHSQHGEETVFTMRANHVGVDPTFQAVAVSRREQQSTGQSDPWNSAPSAGGFGEGEPPF